MSDQNQINYFARTNFRDTNKVFGIKHADRRSHLYAIGATGTGKSTLIKILAQSDIQNGEGLALIDPHGNLVEEIVAQLPEHRKDDLIYFNVPDTAHPLAFNPLEWVPPEKRSLAASGLLQAFKKIWDDSWGPRTEHVLRNALLALLEQPEATLADIPRLLDDRAFRTKVALQVRNEEVASTPFFRHSFYQLQ